MILEAKKLLEPFNKKNCKKTSKKVYYLCYVFFINLTVMKTILAFPFNIQFNAFYFYHFLMMEYFPGPACLGGRVKVLGVN